MPDSQTIGLLVAAMVAGVICFRLYTVLGRRTGQEPQPQPPSAVPRWRRPCPLPAAGAAGHPPAACWISSWPTAISTRPNFSPARARPMPRSSRLLPPATAPALRPLLSPDVYAAFDAGISQRDRRPPPPSSNCMMRASSGSALHGTHRRDHPGLRAPSSPARRHVHESTDVGPSNAIWTRPIPTGPWWRRRAICLNADLRHGRLLAALALLLAACTRQKPPPAVPTRPASVARRFRPICRAGRQSDAEAALASFQRGCAVLDAEAAMPRPWAARAMPERWRTGAASALQARAMRKAFFRREFHALCRRRGDALFTGYYEPQIRGSRTRQRRLSDPGLWPAVRSGAGRSGRCSIPS